MERFSKVLINKAIAIYTKMSNPVTTVETEAVQLVSKEEATEALTYALSHIPQVFYEKDVPKREAKIFVKSENWLEKEEFDGFLHTQMIASAWEQMLQVTICVCAGKNELGLDYPTFYLMDPEREKTHAKIMHTNPEADVDRSMGEVLCFFQEWMGKNPHIVDNLYAQLLTRFRPLEYVKRVLAPCSFGRKVKVEENDNDDDERITSEENE